MLVPCKCSEVHICCADTARLKIVFASGESYANAVDDSLFQELLKGKLNIVWVLNMLKRIYQQIIEGIASSSSRMVM